MRSFPAVPTLLLAFGLAFFASPSQGQRRHGPSPLNTVGGNPSQEFGWGILKEFRAMGIAGDYSFAFELRLMPKRGKETVYTGTMLGTRNARGPISRIDVVDRPIEVGVADGNSEKGVLRLLLQSGSSPYVMMARSDSEGAPELLGPERAFEPIAGSEFTAFDLLMPYVYWQRFVYEGRTDFRRRATHLYWMYPPDDDEKLKALVSGVRIYVDDQFKVMFKAEIFGPDKELLKTFSPGGLKKVDGEYIVDEVDLRNEVTRDKSRFKVLDASVGTRLPVEMFEPQSLMSNLPSWSDAAAGTAVEFEAVK